jgi:Poly(R)-hydroxyalkanoic acid synthase subunit (PHA_synth_III_E)
MSESAEKLEDWIQDWLREQRKKLRPEPAGAGSQQEQAHTADTNAGANPWAQLLEILWSQFDVTRSAAGAFSGASLGLPLGLTREHEQAWRDLAAAQADYKRIETELLAMIHRVQLDALALLERRIRERAAGEPLKSVRELYDLWIEAGEQVFAESAHSPAYCRTQAAFANAGTELRLKQQAVLERVLKTFDLPTRAELNSVHRQLREVREKLETQSQTRAQPSRAPKKQERSSKTSASLGKTQVRRSPRPSKTSKAKKSKAR